MGHRGGDSRDAAAEERDTAAAQRDLAAQRREGAARERDEAAQRRDADASDRERTARDLLAESEAVDAGLAGLDSVDVEKLLVRAQDLRESFRAYIAQARGDRHAASDDRWSGRDDRQQEGASRRAAHDDREAAATDRQAAADDRAAGSGDFDEDQHARIEAALVAFQAGRAVIEQAKGVLIQLLSVDEDQAFAILQRYSSTRNIKLNRLARRLVAAATRDLTPAKNDEGRVMSFLDALATGGDGNGTPGGT